MTEGIPNGASVKTVIGKYPWIARSPELFLEECRRITKIDLDKELMAYLNVWKWHTHDVKMQNQGNRYYALTRPSGKKF